jgi:hypothetical protein
MTKRYVDVSDLEAHVGHELAVEQTTEAGTWLA